jgi:succinate dehydrogenase / fumarate reductase cytochrome b subunit
MSNADIKANRPLSPHPQIYRWKMTMAMSIAQRITGGALYFGTLLLAWWLVALAAGPGPFAFANWVLGSWFGLIVLFGYSWALIEHMLGGFRHFIWDFGYGLGRPARDQLAWANLIGSIVLTVLLWAIALWLRS